MSWHTRPSRSRASTPEDQAPGHRHHAVAGVMGRLLERPEGAEAQALSLPHQQPVMPGHVASAVVFPEGAALMAAHEALSETQFFHGTGAELNPGDVIEPRHQEDRGESVAFAATHPDLAASYGRGGHLYEVEPMDPDEVKVYKSSYQALSRKGSVPGSSHGLTTTPALVSRSPGTVWCRTPRSSLTPVPTKHHLRCVIGQGPEWSDN